jgi:AhpC/TSA antioxidant enzyme
VKVQARLAEMEAAGIDVVAVGFSTDERLAFIGEQFELTFPLLSDPDRRWYRAFAIGRGGWATVFAPRILWGYARLIFRGYRLRRPTDDLRQLGGDILLRGDEVVARWIGTESERRPSVDEVMAAARR